MMKDVRIARLRLENFKGINSKEIEFGGNDIAVYGRNATGKTTLFDAFTWCLFGKDSSDKSDFWAKPHDADGNEIHNLETTVVAELLIDGKAQCFRHTMTENWVKKNGEADRVYSGNAHTYFVNGISRSASEYAKLVAEIINPDVFRMITNPMAFNAIKWDKRREFLLKLSPIDVDKAMLDKPEYKPISKAIEAYDTDIYGVKKVKTDERKRINSELEQIPIRISEQMSTVNALGECEKESAIKEMAEIDRQVERIDSMLSNGADVIEDIKAKAAAVARAEVAIRDAKMSLYKARMTAHTKAITELDAVRARINSAEFAWDDIAGRRERNTEELRTLREEIAAVRNEWYQVDDEKAPEYDGSTICPVCGQKLPNDQIAKAKESYVKDWEAKKEKRLNDIAAKGKADAQRINELEEQISRDTVEMGKLTASINADEQIMADLKVAALSTDGEPDYASDNDIANMQAKLEECAKEYQMAVNGQKPVDETLAQKKRELLARKNELATIEAKSKQRDVCIARVNELEQRQTEIGIQLADVEQFLMLIDRFVTERCRMLEESINSLFPTVRWSLFEKQINGGLKDTCICLINGVQFSDANNAARINAGLEIIQVLSKHYGVTAPVFIDNAEAVNHIQPMEAQRIDLVVTDTDEVLRIEKKGAVK